MVFGEKWDISNRLMSEIKREVNGFEVNWEFRSFDAKCSDFYLQTRGKTWFRTSIWRIRSNLRYIYPLKSWSCHSYWGSHWPRYSYGRKIWFSCYWYGRRFWFWRCWPYWIWQSRLDTIQYFLKELGIKTTYSGLPN